MSEAVAAAPQIFTILQFAASISIPVVGGVLAMIWRRGDSLERKVDGGMKDLDTKLDNLAAKQHEHELASSRSYVQREEFSRVVSNLESKIETQSTLTHEIHRLVAAMKAKLDADGR